MNMNDICFHPFVNIFKHVDLNNWINAKKIGDVFRDIFN